LNCDEHTTGKGWTKGKERFQDFAGLGIKDSDSWPAAETCAACHRKIDPFGFALENFNAIGGWRANYSKDLKINSSGVLPTGEKFADVTDFRSLLISRHEQFTRSLTEKIITYALGREPELADRAVIDGIMKDLTSNKGGFKDLIQAVVLSESFRKN
jgi:hypothetical protein